MARKSPPLVVPEQDAARLFEIAHGEDTGLAMRAKIVLACRNPVQNKEVATHLKVSPSMVGQWKEAYRKEGIEGLLDGENTGRPPSHLSDNLDELVLNASQEEGKWTISSLAEHLGVSVTQIKNSLCRQHISLMRTTQWFHQTIDPLASGSTELLGIWLSHGQGILVACSAHHGLTTKPGVVVTRNSEYSKALSHGTFPLENVITEASYHKGTHSSAQESQAEAFLKGFFSSAPRSPELHYHIFGFGASRATHPRGRLSDTDMTWRSSIDEWLGSFYSWVGAEGIAEKLIQATKLGTAIKLYLDANADGECPVFHWTKAVECIGSEGASIISEEDSSISETVGFEEELASLFAEAGDPLDDEQLVAHIILAVSGKGTHSSSILSSQVANIDDFCFDDASSLLRDLGDMEGHITELARKAEMEAIRLSIEELKKKSLGVMKKVRIEFLNGSLLVNLPIKAVHCLKKGMRLKTPPYIQKICKKVTDSSFRSAYDDFIDSHRGANRSELSYPTFVGDIIQEGLLLITKKASLVKEKLIKWNFSPETGLFMGEELPEELRSDHFESIAIDSTEIMRELIPDWNPENPGFDLPDDPPEEILEHGMKEEDKEMTPEERLDAKIADEFASYFAEYEAADYPYSRPDTTRVEIIRKKTRRKRDEVADDRKEKVLAGFVRWFNKQVRDKNPASSILHKWTMEKSSSQTVFIMPDVVYVHKQKEERRKPPGESNRSKPAPPSTPQKPSGEKGVKDEDDDKKRIGHMNIRIETDRHYYNITSTSKDEAFLEMMAVLAENKLFKRRLLVFMDGEKELYDRLEKLLKPYWEVDYYLDWYHLQKKVYDKLSVALKAKRIPDPRIPPVPYKQKSKRGKIKEMVMTSLSRLYARAVCSFLWVGNCEEAITYLEGINPNHIQVGGKAALNELIDYLRRKQGWITCYALRKRAGLRNASNGVEGLNFTTVACRQKHNGTAWRIGSAVLAALTCVFKNHQEREWFRNRTLSFKLVPLPNATKETSLS